QPTRDQARQFFFDAWGKYRSQQPLSDLEKLALDVILEHPEYHRVLDDPERHRDRDWTPEMGETNPFLHLSMHLAIREQISVDQPQGIRARFERLCAKTGSEHDALHLTMECLGEMLWQAQRHGTAPDAAVYFACLDLAATR
ncbi:MAG TPA: DUF1841 family protein, partial [Burkholderiales bacterium]